MAQTATRRRRRRRPGKVAARVTRLVAERRRLPPLYHRGAAHPKAALLAIRADITADYEAELAALRSDYAALVARIDAQLRDLDRGLAPRPLRDEDERPAGCERTHRHPTEWQGGGAVLIDLLGGAPALVAVGVAVYAAAVLHLVARDIERARWQRQAWRLARPAAASHRTSRRLVGGGCGAAYRVHRKRGLWPFEHTRRFYPAPPRGRTAQEDYTL